MVKKSETIVKNVPIEVSARHIHLCSKDRDRLFGQGYQISKLYNLHQPGEFAARETVLIRGKSDRTLTLRVIGPIREQTQVELSKTDAIALRLDAPIRVSGDLKGTPGALLTGPKGRVRLKRGVINSWRHVHCSFKKAEKLGLKQGMIISAYLGGLGAVTFHNVKVRLTEKARFSLHLDTDEGNAANIKKTARGKIIINN